MTCVHSFPFPLIHCKSRSYIMCDKLCIDTDCLNCSHQVCDAMKLSVHHYSTFRRHATSFLEPAIYHFWKEDQEARLQGISQDGPIIVGGVWCVRLNMASIYNSILIIYFQSCQSDNFPMMTKFFPDDSSSSH